jgi:hypothetical protein
MQIFCESYFDIQWSLNCPDEPWGEQKVIRHYQVSENDKGENQEESDAEGEAGGEVRDEDENIGDAVGEVAAENVSTGAWNASEADLSPNFDWSWLLAVILPGADSAEGISFYGNTKARPENRKCVTTN